MHKNEKSSMDREEYKQIVKILSENNRRIRYLDQLAIIDQWAVIYLTANLASNSDVFVFYDS